MVASHTSVELRGRVFPRRVERLAWTGGKLQITLCPASRQIVLRQDDKEISFPAHQWPVIEEIAARLVLPKEKI